MPDKPDTGRKPRAATKGAIRPSDVPSSVPSSAAAPTTPAPAAAPSPPRSTIDIEALFPDHTPNRYRKRINEQRELFVTELQRAYLSQGLVLYLGAGVSMSFGLPSWRNLIHSLTVAMMARKVKSAAEALKDLKPDERGTAVAALLEQVEKRPQEEKPILMLARALKDELVNDLPGEVALHLYRGLPGLKPSWLWNVIGGALGARAKQAFDWKDELRLPTSALLEAVIALARSQRDVRGVQAIVNYNYDDIVEERLRRENVPCVTVRSGDDPQPRGSLPSFHVHGVLPVRTFSKDEKFDKGVIGNFVFSEDEYHKEYADPYRWSNLTQIGLLGRSKGLFVGLSMLDPNLRRLIDVTHQQYPTIWNYAILPRAPIPADADAKDAVLSNISEDVETNSFRKIGVKVLWVDDVKTEVAPLLQKVREIPAE